MTALVWKPPRPLPKLRQIESDSKVPFEALPQSAFRATLTVTVCPKSHSWDTFPPEVSLSVALLSRFGGGCLPGPGSYF